MPKRNSHVGDGLRLDNNNGGGGGGCNHVYCISRGLQI